MKATRNELILVGLVLALFIVVAAKYGEQLMVRLQNAHQPARSRITGPATLHPFDERLSLLMPVAFGSPTEFPLEKLPVEERGKVQKMIQRTAYFNGVYIVVMKLTNAPGTKGKIEDSLYKTFSRNADPQSPNMPKINRTSVSGVHESGAIRFPATFGNTKGQMTAVAIKSETEDALWCINAWGAEKAADQAENIARDFVFK
jgi:hypothetical protein